MRLKGKITKVTSEGGYASFNFEGKGQGEYFKLSDVTNFDGRPLVVGRNINFEYRLETSRLPPDRSTRKYSIRDVYVRYPRIQYNPNQTKDFRHHPFEWEADDLRTAEEKAKAEEKAGMSPTKESQSLGPLAESLALGVFDHRIKLVSLSADGTYQFLDSRDIAHRIIYPSVFEEISLRLAIEEFEDLVNSLSARESDFQKLFERHPEFILTDDYRRAHSHVVLTRDYEGDLIPDFILQPVQQHLFCDLLELKLPNEPVFINKKNREHFSAAVTEAAAQLRVYRNFFDDRANRDRFERQCPDLRIYKPRMFVIIGRHQAEPDDLTKQAIRADNPGLFLQTYEEVLARAKYKNDRLLQRNKLFRS